MISSAGTAAVSIGRSSVSSERERSRKRNCAARATTTASLANSLGWIEKPGSAYQRRAPLISGAKNGSPSSASTTPA